MSNDARRVGAKFETDTLGYVRGRGVTAERLAKAGSNDEGDLVLSGGEFIAELKARRDAKSPLNLGSWLEEARREAGKYDVARNRTEQATPILVIKNPRKSIGKSFVVMYLEDFIEGTE